MRLDQIAPSRASSRITPAGAVRHIDTLKTAPKRNEYDGTTSYDLLCQENLIGSRLHFLKSHGLPFVKDELLKLESLRLEIRSRQSNHDLWAPTAMEWTRRNLIQTYFPDEGPLRRELYPKHMEFFTAGKRYRRRLACCANKIGKSTTMGGYEVVIHATGVYPEWWPGKRFDHPILAWVANKSGKETRDINERILLGPPGDEDSRGTGLIPSHRLIDTTPKPGIPNGCEFMYIRHVSGGTSVIQSKSFDSGRTAFQGAPEVHVIWHDEECPKPIAEESALRTMTCGGILMFTYTPILGMTELTVEMFDEAGIDIADLAVDVEQDAEIEEREMFNDETIEHQYGR